MTPTKIRILLVDDQESVLKGLAMRLALEEDLQVIGQAKDGKEALQLIEELRPHLVVMDIEMPNMDGISAARAIHGLAPEVKVIVLSLHGDPTLRAKAHEAGAVAYVEKRGGAIKLIQEIRKAFSEINQSPQV